MEGLTLGECHWLPTTAGRRRRSECRATSAVQSPFAGKWQAMTILLSILAVILVIVGIVQLVQGQIIFGIILIILGCLVGPGGYSIARRR